MFRPFGRERERAGEKEKGRSHVRTEQRTINYNYSYYQAFSSLSHTYEDLSITYACLASKHQGHGQLHLVGSCGVRVVQLCTFDLPWPCVFICTRTVQCPVTPTGDMTGDCSSAARAAHRTRGACSVHHRSRVTAGRENQRRLGMSAGAAE